MVVEAVKRGYIAGDAGKIRLAGDSVPLPLVRFRLPPRARDVDLLRAGFRGRLPDWLLSSVNNRLRPSPGFAPEACSGCGECSRVCPPRAIRMENKRPRVDLDRCIRCFCCHELCPEKAVKINRPYLGRLLFQ
jgi:ferredoxin